MTYVIEKLRPKIAFVDDARRFGGALQLPCLDGVEIVAAKPDGAPVPVTPLADLDAGDASVDIDACHAKVGPGSLAKIMFTSGSSSDPKGVLTTHRMLCVNQAQQRAVMPIYGERPPVLTDWLPWNHVFGGSTNVNMILSNGGTFNIDHGKPTAAHFAATLRNTRERPGTLWFNVPVGYAMMADAFGQDEELKRRIFADLDVIFYAGASLPQNVWSAIEEASIEARGGLPLMMSSWGMTETAPACVMVHEPVGRSGVIGVPLPGLEIKLLPNDVDRWEIRVRGPNVMPGYFEDPERSAKAFDEEGFLITGDAVGFVDPDDASRGLAFDGRVSEDFKLVTGTWVQAGVLRMNVLKELAGLAQDVVICGHDRAEIGLFVFPAARQLQGADASRGALINESLNARIEERLRALNASVSGSAKRITRAIVLADPPSIEGQEITDKGSLNINRILTRRADLLERLYDNEDPALIRV